MKNNLLVLATISSLLFTQSVLAEYDVEWRTINTRNFIGGNPDIPIAKFLVNLGDKYGSELLSDINLPVQSRFKILIGIKSKLLLPI